MLIIIKFWELLLRISPRIINSLRSYIKHWKECFLLFPNTLKLIKKNSAVPCFSNLLLGVWKSEETLFLVFNILPQKVLEMLWIYHEKITEIFMGFGFIVCNKNANYLCFKMELHRVLF